MTTTTSWTNECDVIVVGAGHAGSEAALAAARSGSSVLCVTPNLDRVGFMPCNPSIGGPGKSHIVAEIDALGGAMAEVADLTAVQTRRLNTSKGPAVQAIRHQIDKTLYAQAMKLRVEEQVGVTLCQDEVSGIEINRDGSFMVTLRVQGVVQCRSVVVTAGTFLRAAMISGEGRTSGGRAGDSADELLARSLADMGVRTRRFKTGTPPRIDGRTVDFSKLDVQPGDSEPGWLSRAGKTGSISAIQLPISTVHEPFATRGWRTQLSCHRTETNSEAHELIRANLDRAPMFNGSIEGAGPRYCPSIEDKVARYIDKAAHPIFLEPEGWQTNELYVQGMSTSLPPDIQQAVLRSVVGLENVHITRYGYAVEYDSVDANELDPSLQARAFPGLFLAGQINGTSGYEEAAGQGLVAGLNASRYARDLELVTISRTSGYLGVMIDDLVNLPFSEPYRMLTARAEYRLLMRPDSAERRLSSDAFSWGLISLQRNEAVSSELLTIDQALDQFRSTTINPNSERDLSLQRAGQTPIAKPMSLAEIMRRPTLTLSGLAESLPESIPEIISEIPAHRLDEFESDLKYATFIEREEREVNRLRQMNTRPIPSTTETHIPGLRNEARQQLEQHRPKTYGDAQRLPGVTHADLSALLIYQSRLDHVYQ